MANECWAWAGSYYPSGYGQAWSPKLNRGTQAHRLVYETLVGSIPDGFQIDHVCRNRGCVNPRHMRVVVCRENLLAPGSTCIAAINAMKTHCTAGHAFTPENIYMYRGKRHCRACKTERKRLARKRRHSACGNFPTRDAARNEGMADVVTAGIDFANSTSPEVARNHGTNPLYPIG